jgi:S1-C subfamily serine protease
MRNRITVTITLYTLIGGLLLLLACAFSVLIGGYKLYTRVLTTEATQQELMHRQQEEKAQQETEAAQLLNAQQAELLQTKTELEETKQQSVKTNAQVQTLTKTLEKQSTTQKDIVISSNDLTPYTTGVVQVVCSGPSGVSSGSGSLFTFSEVSRAVLTNHHVVENASKCVAIMTSTANTTTGMFALEGSIYTYNQNTDEAILALGKSLSTASVPIANYNYSLSTMKRCTSLMPVGTPVVIIGFPAYAKRDTTITIETIGTINSIYRTVTNGIISGYDTSKPGDANYFVSAKIDNGNSGGIALAKDANGVCALGLPTWLTVGNYETQGLVQNVSNLLPKK